MRIKNKDLTSVPVTPNPADPWAASDPAAFMKARQDVAGGKPAARFIISRALAGRGRGDESVIAHAEQGPPNPIAGLSRRRFLSWASASLALITAIALPARRAEADTANLRTDSTQITADDDTLTL